MHGLTLFTKAVAFFIFTSPFVRCVMLQQQEGFAEFNEDILNGSENKSGETFSTCTHSELPSHTLRYKRPTICDPNVNQVSGYLDVEKDKHFFFWFFESRSDPKHDPVILWLNGGPGCSSMTGLLMELGPCTVNEEGTGTDFNKYSWNDKANVIFLDQPLNVGYSYGTGGATNTGDAAEDVYAFLKLFFLEFPEFADLDFHVAGEAYAGHYVPAIGSVINRNNKVNLKSQEARVSRTVINLKSLLIGNGLTDPLIQYKYFGPMACDNSYGPVLDRATCNKMEAQFPACEQLIKKCYNEQTPSACISAAEKCNNDQIIPFVETGVNPYDVRVPCKGSNNCYEINDAIHNYLNMPKVMKELGAEVERFEGCNNQLSNAFDMAGDWMHPYVHKIPDILEDGIKVLVYTGDADYICNWMGSKAWTMQLPWSGHDEFVQANDTRWYSKRLSKQAGELRKTKDGAFAFLRIFGAGHMAPYDQPESILDMVQQWVDEKLN